nr:MAG TPA: hypothetical protein [Caudoviricetes sp.]
MQPFKEYDKRRFHIRDIDDVLDWLTYQAAKNEEAVRVVRTMRNRLAITESSLNSLQHDLDEKNRTTNVVPTHGGEIKIEEVSLSGQEKTAIVEELKKAIEEENRLDQESETPDNPQDEVEEIEDVNPSEMKEEKKELSVGYEDDTYTIERSGLGFVVFRKNGRLTARKVIAPAIVAALTKKLEDQEALEKTLDEVIDGQG